MKGRLYLQLQAVDLLRVADLSLTLKLDHLAVRLAGHQAMDVVICRAPAHGKSGPGDPVNTQICTSFTKVLIFTIQGNIYTSIHIRVYIVLLDLAPFITLYCV